jgi:hypothetical protein
MLAGFRGLRHSANVNDASADGKRILAMSPAAQQFAALTRFRDWQAKLTR